MRYFYHIRSQQTRSKTLLTLVLFSLFLPFAQAQSISAANQVKAVFLLNFSQFVTWPAITPENNNTPFVIGILGPNPFGGYLERVVEGERVGRRPIIVQRYSEAKEIQNCQILFIAKELPPETLQELSNNGILTVSDKDNFAQNGGIIRFYIEDNKIRLQINLPAAKSARLTISSKLLRLANVMNVEP